MTVFLQGALGMTPLEAGLTMMPMSLMLMFVAPVSGRLSDRIGARWILTTGLTLVTVGILLITSQRVDDDQLANVATSADRDWAPAWG